MLSSIIENVKSFHDPIELEFRYLIDQRQYKNGYDLPKTIQLAKDLIKKYAGQPVGVEQTINFISKDCIKQMTFINGEQQKDKVKYYKKERQVSDLIFTHHSLPAFKLDLNYEIPTAEICAKNITLARIKLRYTIYLEVWRLDITLTKSIDSFANPVVLKNAKNEMFYTITPETFVDKAPWASADSIEFETEYVKSIKEFSLDDFKIADEIFEGVITQKSEYQEIIYRIAKMIAPDRSERFRQAEGIKQLSNQVIELDKNLYLKNLHGRLTEYYMTDKIDGVRALVLLGKKSYALTDKATSLDIQISSDIILDTEFYEGHYYIFDVMYYNKNICVEPFKTRLELIPTVIKEINSGLFTTKDFKVIDSVASLGEFKKAKKPYETDGLILTPQLGDYFNMKVYKYKPIEKLTVDFLIKKCPDALIGIEPYIPKKGSTLYLLYCGISSKMFRKLRMTLNRGYEENFNHIDSKRLPPYMPVLFMPSNAPYSHLYYDERSDLDNSVGEFHYSEHWRLTRLRVERQIEITRGNYFGNNYRVAELTWMSYSNPLIIENIQLGYFAEHDSELHKVSRNYNSFVKNQIFESIRGADAVMDMASGKGQDLFRYAKFGVKNMTFLEIDADALMELIYRKYDYVENLELPPMSIAVKQMNLNNDYKKNIEQLVGLRIKAKSMDYIVCNFAFHYFVRNKASIMNIGKFAKWYLKDTGALIITAFDGGKINDLLNENNGDWTVKTGQDIKYSIRRKAKKDELAEHGQEIEVMLPFSQNEYYREYLVNIEYIAQVLKMTLEVNKSFADYLPDYKHKLSDEDAKYVGLYHYYKLRV